MGEAKLKRALMDEMHSDGLEYSTYTAAELDARKAAYKAAFASQSPDAIRARNRREKLKATDPEYSNKERLRQKLIRADNPGASRARYKQWEQDHADWVDNYKENRKGLARRGEFIPIDSEGQDYPYSDKVEKDIVYNGVVFPPHATYLWGAYSHKTKTPLYLTDPRSKGKVKYKLSVKAIFDWPLNDVKGTYGDANYVMFGMSYDMSQLFCQLPHDVSYEIFKGARFEDEEEFAAPVFWGEYAVKLVQSKWLILWRLRDHNTPYEMDTEGGFILDKKGRMQLDTVQKIQVYETFGYFQTGFAKVVEDMMKEQKSSASKQLPELNGRKEYVNSAEFETMTRFKYENRASGLGSYYTAEGELKQYTMEQRIAGELRYEMMLIDEKRRVVEAELNDLSKDAALIKEFKPLRGDFRSKEIEPIREYTTGELRQLAVRMEQIRQTLEKLELFPTSWHGPGAVASALIMKYKIRDHFGDDISTNVTPGSPQDYAHHSFAGIWEIKEGYEDARPFDILKGLYAKRRAIKNDIEAKNKEIDKLNAAIKERNLIKLEEGKELEPEIPYEYDITEKVLKLILNSVYGKLAQFVGSSNKVPNCANPYYAAAITAYCRRRLIKLAMVDPSAIVFFATDGIMAIRPLHHLPIPIKGVKNCPVSPAGKRVKDESAGDVISLGDWEYARRDGGIFVMAGVYVHDMVDKDDKGDFIFDAQGRPKVNAKYTGRLRGADISKYAEGDDGQPWLVSSAIKAWLEPFDLDDKETYPAIVSAYKKFITVGSVLTPRYAPLRRDGQLVENNRYVIEERYNRAGRWSLKADDPDNEKIKLMNIDIRAWNEDVKSRTKGKLKGKHDGDKLKLGLIEELPERVFERTIHVHDAGLKRVHNKSRSFDYCWQGESPPSRTIGLIETVPAGNYKTDSEGERILNWTMSAPRMPEWLNKADEAAAEDMELDTEIKAGILGFDEDGDNERTVDIYADT